MNDKKGTSRERCCNPERPFGQGCSCECECEVCCPVPDLGKVADPHKPFFSVLVRGPGVKPQEEGTLGPSNARWAGPLCVTRHEAENCAELKRRGILEDGTGTPSGTKHDKEYVVAEFAGFTAATEWPPAVWPS